MKHLIISYCWFRVSPSDTLSFASYLKWPSSSPVAVDDFLYLSCQVKVVSEITARCFVNDGRWYTWRTYNFLISGTVLLRLRANALVNDNDILSCVCMCGCVYRKKGLRVLYIRGFMRVKVGNLYLYFIMHLT